MLSLLGFMIFALGGGVDFAWHTLFGFEADEEALLSPAHLLLATGAILLTSGPLRAACWPMCCWQCSSRRSNACGSCASSPL
jgi:hypothetical protein